MGEEEEKTEKEYVTRANLVRVSSLHLGLLASLDIMQVRNEILTLDNMIATGPAPLAKLSSHLGDAQSWLFTLAHPGSFCGCITVITGHFKMGHKFHTRLDLSIFLAFSFNSLKETMRIGTFQFTR